MRKDPATMTRSEVLRELQRLDRSMAWLDHRITVCRLGIAGGLCCTAAMALAVFASEEAKLLAVAAGAYFFLVAAPAVDSLMKQRNPWGT